MHCTKFLLKNPFKNAKILFLFVSLFCVSQAKDTYGFNSQTFQEAKEKRKLIFLFVGSDVELETRNYLQSIAKNEDFFTFIRTQMIFSVLDVDRNPALSVRYPLPTLPGFLVLDEKGTIHYGATKPAISEILPTLQRMVLQHQGNPELLNRNLKEFQSAWEDKTPRTVSAIIDATMNTPNHISLDLGRYILSLPKNHVHYQHYMEQFEEWVKSENFDFSQGSFFMPRGYSTFFGESKYSFFNFKLKEMLLDFYIKSQNPVFKTAFLKSMQYLPTDLFLEQRAAYSVGYSSKKYFQLPLEKRLNYFPPSPRNSDLCISQILFMKILYKVMTLREKGLIQADESSFLDSYLQNRLPLFSSILKNYEREDGLLYFTREKEFTNFETQIEFFALLQLMYFREKPQKETFAARMQSLFEAIKKEFYDSTEKMICDIPLKTLAEHKSIYQYPLFFVREHARFFLFLDFLAQFNKNPEILAFKDTLSSAIYTHNQKYPYRFYWLSWYENLSKKQGK